MKKSFAILAVAGAVFIGYLSGCKRNEMPVIESLVPEYPEDSLVVAGDTVKVICTATDADENELFYTWDASGGGFTESEDGTEITWVAPNQSGVYDIVCKVTDLEEDTVNFVFDTFSVNVQNYFPMASGNWWYYDGFMWVIIVHVPTKLKKTVFSREEIGVEEIRWNMELAFEFPKDTSIDNSTYYKVRGDSIWEVNEDKGRQYLICILPLWIYKTWDYREGSTAEVTEIKDRGTEAFSFLNCAHIEVEIGSDSTRNIWLAPDVGIIEENLLRGEFSLYEFELMDYDLQ